MSKVFCRECRYFDHAKIFHSPYISSDMLECKLEAVYGDEYDKRRNRWYRIKARDKNKNNDCKDFKPKRWWEYIF